MEEIGFGGSLQNCNLELFGVSAIFRLSRRRWHDLRGSACVIVHCTIEALYYY
jgi:hypothetical protein